MRLQLSVLGPGGEIADLGRYLGQPLGRGIGDDRGDEPAGNADGHRNIRALVLAHDIAREGHVAGRNLHQGQAQRLDQHIVDRKLDPARRQGVVEFRTQFE